MSGDAVACFMRDGQEVRKAVDALLDHVEHTYGLFHDSATGWQRLRSDIEDFVQTQVRQGRTREQVLELPVIHGESDIKTGRIFHQSKVRDRIAACTTGGQNEVTLSNLCLISIYSFWEDRTRVDIARALGIEDNDVQSDLFGDVAKFRNVILHAGGIMDGRARSLRVLKWFNEGDRVIVDREKLHQVIELIRAFPNGLRTIGYDPTKPANKGSNAE